jgi:hypothetical protein
MGAHRQGSQSAAPLVLDATVPDAVAWYLGHAAEEAVTAGRVSPSATVPVLVREVTAVALPPSELSFGLAERLRVWIHDVSGSFTLLTAQHFNPSPASYGPSKLQELRSAWKVFGEQLAAGLLARAWPSLFYGKEVAALEKAWNVFGSALNEQIPGAGAEAIAWTTRALTTLDKALDAGGDLRLKARSDCQTRR